MSIAEYVDVVSIAVHMHTIVQGDLFGYRLLSAFLILRYSMLILQVLIILVIVRIEIQSPDKKCRL